MKYTKRIIISLIIITLAVGAVFLSWKAYQNRQMLTQTFISAVSIKPEAFTELYFQDNEHLPKKITNNTQFMLLHPTLALFTFQFTVHNLEGKNMTYPYEVFTMVNKTKTVIDKGLLVVKSNQYLTTSESFSAPKVFPDTEVIVNLTGKNQIISFWMKIIK